MSVPTLETAEDPAVGGPPSTEPVRAGWRLTTLFGCHSAVDTYSALVPAVLGILAVRCSLDPSQAAWVLSCGSLTSGLAQPVCAWISDRFDSRAFGAVGMAIGAVFLSLLGTVSSFTSLMLVYSIGIFGVGMFHPVAASAVGSLSRRRRSAGLSAFFVAGMVGWIIGVAGAPRLMATSFGFRILPWMMIPGLVLAALMYRAVRHVRHNTAAPAAYDPAVGGAGVRWLMVAILFVAASLRFAVNLALMFLFVEWMQIHMRDANPTWLASQVANSAAPLTGNLNACNILGMALGGIGSGLLVRTGREKLPLILVPASLAVSIWYMPQAGLPGAYGLAILAGIGHAAMVPVGMAVAQRLLPHRTSLASSLLLGGAWAAAMVGPRFAEWFLTNYGIETAFHATSVALFAAGLVVIPLRSSVLRD